MYINTVRYVNINDNFRQLYDTYQDQPSTVIIHPNITHVHIRHKVRMLYNRKMTTILSPPGTLSAV